METVYLILVFVLGIVAGLIALPYFLDKKAVRSRQSNIGDLNRLRAEAKEKHKEMILEGIDMQKSINNDSVQNLLRVSDATATRYLDELEKEGKIKQVGDTGKGVFYERV